jgi:hypothetical protein
MSNLKLIISFGLGSLTCFTFYNIYYPKCFHGCGRDVSKFGNICLLCTGK